MIDNYNKLSVGKFQELRKIELLNREEIDIQVEMISILADLTEEEVLDLPLDQYREYASKLSFLTKQPNVGNKCPKKIKLQGREYYVLDDVKQMRTGQYIDYQNYLSNDDTEAFLPYILSCFVIPKGKTYGNDYDLAEVVEDIRNNMPIEIAMDIAGFFFRKFQTLTRNMLTYLAWKTRRAMRKTKDGMERKKMEEVLSQIQSLRDLGKSGDGFLMLIQSLKH